MGGFWKKINRLFNPRIEGRHARQFSLRRPESISRVREQQPGNLDLTVQTQLQAPEATPLKQLAIRAQTAAEDTKRALDELNSDVPADLTLAIGLLRDALHMDRSVDATLREFSLPFSPPVRACLVYIDGTIDGAETDRAILIPLMGLPRVAERATGSDLLRQIDSTLLPGRRTQQTFQLRQVIGAIVSGQCALLIDTVPGVLTVDLRNWPGRSVETPTNEQVVRGPQEGFTETLRINTALLRRRMQTPDLILEPGQVGRRSRTDLCIAYLEGVVNPDLVDEVKYRISTIDVDMLYDATTLEQYLDESPLGLFPMIAATQRPDRAVAAIAGGRVVLMVDGSPFALIAPTVFSDFLRNPEDYYLKWPYATFLRLIRIFGLMITLLLPGLYIAVANYHQEMIPSALLLAIAASREAVPFPAPIEVLMMELAFEVIREGSLRIPMVMGQTVGIVGALILGQAAVQASIVSPILVIVVAVTALGSFTMPDYAVSLTLRVLRFIFILLGALFGLFGIAIGLFVISAHAASLRSFGVPYMAPVGPRLPASPDSIIRAPLETLEHRASMLFPQDKRRKAKTAGRWNPMTVSEEGDDKQ